MNNQNIMLGKSNLEIDTVPKNYLKLYLSGIKIVIAEKKKRGGAFAASVEVAGMRPVPCSKCDMQLYLIPCKMH